MLVELAAAPATSEPTAQPLVRAATHADIAECLPMARSFFDESGMAGVTEYDQGCAIATLRQLIDSRHGALFVAGSDRLVGMAGALAYPMYFNTAHLSAQELFWWVAPERRGGTVGVRLMQALEKWARGMGCRTLTMVCLPIDGPAQSHYARNISATFGAK